MKRQKVREEGEDTYVTTILSVKLGSCIGMPKSRLHALLRHAAEDTNRARNAALRNWIRWREDHPDYVPQPRRLRNGEIKRKPNGDPVLEDCWISQECVREMYHAAVSASPLIQAGIASAARNQVQTKLAAKVPWNTQGKHRFFHEAVAAYDFNPPCWRGCSIPVLNKDARLAYLGWLNRSVSAKMDQVLKKESGSTCLLYWPLLGLRSGYHRRSLLIYLEVRDLSEGHRQILYKVAKGEIKLNDSLVTEKNGDWFLRLVLKLPTQKILKDEALIFEPASPESVHPFAVRTPDGKSRSLGFGPVYEHETKRAILRRKAISARYSRGANAGRGRRGFYAATRPITRRVSDFVATLRKKICADVVQAAIRNQCGKILYREPSLFLRQLSWYEKRGLHWDWTALNGQLSHAAKRAGLELVVERLSYREVKEKWPSLNKNSDTTSCAASAKKVSKSVEAEKERLAEIRKSSSARKTDAAVSPAARGGKVQKRRAVLASRKSKR